MQRRALFGQAAGQRRFRRAGDVGFPLIPIERTAATMADAASFRASVT